MQPAAHASVRAAYKPLCSGYGVRQLMSHVHLSGVACTVIIDSSSSMASNRVIV
jgi:hypothetical protein